MHCRRWVKLGFSGAVCGSDVRHKKLVSICHGLAWLSTWELHTPEIDGCPRNYRLLSGSGRRQIGATGHALRCCQDDRGSGPFRLFPAKTEDFRRKLALPEENNYLLSSSCLRTLQNVIDTVHKGINEERKRRAVWHFNLSCLGTCLHVWIHWSLSL